MLLDIGKLTKNILRNKIFVFNKILCDTLAGFPMSGQVLYMHQWYIAGIPACLGQLQTSPATPCTELHDGTKQSNIVRSNSHNEHTCISNPYVFQWNNLYIRSYVMFLLVTLNLRTLYTQVHLPASY